ncbi:MAG: hypothetical protein HYX75_24520 [Acidobacteria bacterium]|nr:hypothetical protein [Acidobacteriota bacterium]
MNQITVGQLSEYFLRPQLPPDATQPLRGEKPPKVETQLEAWFKDIEAAKKTDFVFELEVWLRSLDRFFTLKNQPFSEEVVRNITVKDFSEELKILKDGVERMGHLVSLIQSSGDVAYSRFEDFLESNINRYYGIRPKEARAHHENGFAEAMDVLGEAVADFRLILGEMCRLPKISFHSFLSAGRLLTREVNRNGFLTYLLDRKFKPYYDRISNPFVCRVIYDTESATVKKELARLFLELNRQMRYLDFIGKDLQREGPLKRGLLIFCLVRHELRQLTRRLHDRSAEVFEKGSSAYEGIESAAYCLEMEAKKVYQLELLDFSDSQSGEAIKVKVENAFGILKRSFQEAIVTLIQTIHPEVRGEEVFDSYVTRQAQSIQLRRDLNVLFEQIRAFIRKRDIEEMSNLIRNIVDFQQSSLKYLMYKDWQDFDLFLEEVKKARSLPSLLTILHKFETFLASLLIEVGKRSVFVNLSVERREERP